MSGAMSILSVGLGTLLAIAVFAVIVFFAPAGAQSRTTEPANAE